MEEYPQNLRKILLISFYLYPCTLTPSQRISYWAKHLHKLGFYPTVVTREWSGKIKSHFDTKKAIGTEIRHEKFETHEVYYLPFRPGILDKAYEKWGEGKFRILFLLTKLLDVVLVKWTLRFTSFKNFFPFVKKINDQEHFEKLIISGEPFYLFKVGYLSHIKLGLDWIADYRDDWSTSQVERQKGSGLLRRILFYIEGKYEKKWVNTAESITSVSENYTQRISSFVDVPGLVIENGFEESILDLPHQTKFPEFTVVYSGTLYPSQNVSIILGALKKSVENGQPFKLVFLGTGFDMKEKNRINKIVGSELKPYVEITERIPRTEALIYLQKAHVVLSIAHENLIGIPSSKLYEYIGLKKPVLLCPSDQDVMEAILSEVGLGFFANDEKSCLAELDKIKKLYQSGEIGKLEVESSKKVHQYSRFVQMSKISSLIAEDYPTISK